jgi:hypothetical protein
MFDHWREYGPEPNEAVFLERSLGAVFFLAHLAALEAHPRTRGVSQPETVERLLRFLERYVPCDQGPTASRMALPWRVAMVILQLQAAGTPVPSSVSCGDARAFLREVAKRLA